MIKFDGGIIVSDFISKLNEVFGLINEDNDITQPPKPKKNFKPEDTKSIQTGKGAHKLEKDNKKYTYNQMEPSEKFDVRDKHEYSDQAVPEWCDNMSYNDNYLRPNQAENRPNQKDGSNPSIDDKKNKKKNISKFEDKLDEFLSKIKNYGTWNRSKN